LLDAITSGLVGISSRDFLQSTSREAGVINRAQFLQCLPQKICDGQKIVQNFARFKLVNFGPQIKKVIDVSIDPPKCTFSGDCISALRGCCSLKFLHTLQIDQGYLAHIPTETVAHKNFNRENLKFGIKFSLCTSLSSRLNGDITNFYPYYVSRARGDNVGRSAPFGRAAPKNLF